MKRAALCLTAALLIAASVHLKAQKNTLFDYARAWKSVEASENLGQPRTALKTAEEIYSAAKKENNSGQFVKAVIYKIKLQADFREDAELRSIYDLRKEIESSKEPVKQVLTSMLAELYSGYSQSNRWRFENRTTVAGKISDSISTWDLNTIAEVTKNTYLKSLQNPELLKSIPVSEFEPILYVPSDQKNIKKETFRPTLYDFLAWRALEYFSAGGDRKNAAADKFLMNDPAFMLPASEWVKLPEIPFDSSSPEIISLKIYRDITLFHLSDKDQRSLIDAELSRISYIHNKAVFPHKDSLYITALEKIEKIYSSSPWSTGISFQIVSFLHNQGELYDPLISQNHKWDLKKALETAEAAIAKYPESAGAIQCKNEINSIKTTSLSINAGNAFIPQKPSLATFTVANSEIIYFRIIKTDNGEDEKTQGMNRDEMIKYLQGLNTVKEWTVAVPSDGDFHRHSADFIIPELPAGFYFLVASTDRNWSDITQAVTFTQFSVSNISYVNRRDNEKGLLIYVLDRESGKPIKKAVVETYVRRYDYQSGNYKSSKTGEFTTDENGFLQIPAPAGQNNYNFYVKIKYKDQVYYSEGFYLYKPYQREEKETYTTTFFTDRAIYRPGQTVYFKGIMIRNKGKEKEVAAGRQALVTFFDVNSQKIEEKTFTTNDFGSFNGSFTIPLTGLKGRMSISTSTGSVGFSVEEYKRPVFEAEFLPVKGNFRLNDTIRVYGKATAYAGNSVAGATVSYRVVRMVIFPFKDFWWFPIPDYPETEIANGIVKTGDDGSFSFVFNAIPDPQVNKNEDPVFTYRLYADVTDINGEMHSAEGSVSAGYKSLIISADVHPETDLSKENRITVKTENLNNQKTPATVDVEIFSLRQPDHVIYKHDRTLPDIFIIPEKEFREKFPQESYKQEEIPENFAVEKSLLKRSLNTGTDSVIDLKKELSLKPGIYRLVMKSIDPYGNEVKITQHFTAFDPSSKELPAKEPVWFVQLDKTAEPGQNASFLIGCGEKDVNVIYEITDADSVISRNYITISDEQKKIEIPVKEEYRGNFGVTFLFVKSNRSFQKNATVVVPFSNKKLDIKLETFRDKLLPGQDEEWRFKISGPGGKVENAEFLASMYDQSLDAFVPNNWTFDIFNSYFGVSRWESGRSFRTGTTSGQGEYTWLNYPPKIYEELNWFGFGFGGRARYMKSGAINEMVVMEDKMPAASTNEQVHATAMAEPPVPAEAQKPSVTIPVKTRKDFHETAFFYPSLMTDSSGSIILKFTVPEALTKWKMSGLATTKDLKSGMITKEVITQKDLMVFPNAPRFVRQGDTVVFSTKITNMSDRALSGDATIEITDPFSGPLNDIIQSSRTVSFTTTAGGNAVAQWTLVIPDRASLSMISYRITAQAGNFSDGEEKMIPVLTNRMMITESMPMPVRGNGSFSFNMEKLEKAQQSKSLKNYRLTLEFASNPVWYAIQALPALDDPKYQSADAIFNSFYANSIASHIAGSDQKIRAVFESWKNITPDALLSNLEKNQDLKYAAINETPWVMEAKDESARKQRIGRLFDIININAKLDENVAKLRKMQLPEGGWSWFEGMTPSTYITQQIITGFGKLSHLGIREIRSDNKTWNMVTKAVSYTDRELVKSYEWLKKHNKKYREEETISYHEIQYLYARTFFIKEMPVNPATKEAFDYYTAQAEKYWLHEDIYFQGMIALSLNRLGKKEVPALIMKSLSEKALHSPEMGMYWAFKEGYYWYQAPVETQSLLIEAYDEVLADKSSVDEMKIWLLKQKQTSDWKTGRATADACYALLLRGKDLLSENQKVTFNIGKERIDPSEIRGITAEAGTGYFRMSWDGNDIKPEMGKVTVNKTGEGIAWGALYWQYFEDLDKITEAQTPLKLEKKVFREKNTPSGPVLEPVTSGKPLEKGDKLKIRIVITADRDMEYIHMKDMRASAFEPPLSSAISGFQYQDNLGYYQSTTDAATNFFFDYLAKGTYVFEYPLNVNASGNYSNGVTTIQCMYAPEFGAHSEGIRVKID